MEVRRAKRIGARRRRGSLIIESVVALALLTTAFVALGKLAAASAAVGRDANQRLAAMLTAENALERLRTIPFDTVVDEAPKIAAAMQVRYGCEIRMVTKPFAVGGCEAIHVSVTVQREATVSITLHDWLINQPLPASAGGGEDA
jgi:Tfp pilus assembly protein PilV